MQKSDAHEQQTGGYEQCRSEKTRQIRQQATDKSKQKELNDNPYIIANLCSIVDEIDQMVERCVKVYKEDSLPWIYHFLREKLINKDVGGFVESVTEVLKCVPYLSRKKKFDESHFQTMIQLLLMVMGFKVISEQPLSDGRIDMAVKIDELTYIFEFKYTEGEKSQANRAMKQIKDKGYADPYKLTSKEIIAVGVSFSGKTKNINGHTSETVFLRH